MVGSWPCKVSSEIHVNGRRVSEPVQKDKGKAIVLESVDEKDPKRTHIVLSVTPIFTRIKFCQHRSAYRLHINLPYI
jgi:hypothetical protein